MEKGVLYGNGNILGYDRVGKELVINPEQLDRYMTGICKAGASGRFVISLKWAALKPQWESQNGIRLMCQRY
jgi:hypothetical protein